MTALKWLPPFVLLKLQNCSCKYYETVYCIIVFIDEEKRFFSNKRKLFNFSGFLGDFLAG